MMYKYKKLFAGILAMTLCFSSMSVAQVYAEEEDTASEEVSDTAEDGSTEDGEEAEEEETREEDVEEIEVTADQVETYMTKLNSCDGITFYLRPEDYKDTITDEDVQDLLKHVDLAGIDDKTGEVVCTLEEEDDNKEAVIFLSDKGRWLVYTDPDYKKVTMVRKIVSTLDSEYLFLSMDNKTLELYNDDFDEVVRSYTTDGKSEDGKVTYTDEEKQWNVVLADTYDALYTSARYVTENDNLTLYVDDEKGTIGLEEKSTGKMWWSTPENVGHDSVATGTIVNDLSSSLKMVYGEPDARSTTIMRSAADAKITVKDISDGIKITYDFKKAGITIPVEYTLGENYLEAKIDTEDIDEEDTSSTGKLTTNISMMANFGATSTEEEGYFVIPDGCGALINFNNGKTSAKSYSGTVYGSDVTAVPLEEPDVTEQLSLPMYGIVNTTDNSAMMVVCTDGDSNAKLNASVSGQSKSSYNICGFDFTVRDSDSYYMSGDNTTTLTVFEDGDIKTDTLAVRYYPIDAEDTPSYADISDAYREYLTEEENVENTVTSENPELYLDFYGGTQKEKSILGIPVNMKTSMTSYDQAQDILETLYGAGVDDMTVQYHNWTNAGIKSKVDYKAKASSTLGGKKDWNSLISYAEENNIDLYPAVDNEAFNSGNGYYSFTDTAVRISGSYARIYDYNLAFGNESSDDPLSLLSPSAFTEIYDKLAKNYSKAGLTKVSLGSMTTALYGDYGKNEISRDKAQELLEESYQSIQDADISILADQANAYALSYVTAVADVPLQSSGYDVFDADIPFYQMVLHGLKSYSASAVNASANPSQAVLLSIATGSNLHYDMIGEETSTLKDTNLDSYYYAGAENWTDHAANAYALEKEVLSGLGKETISDYERLGNVITTTYSNGTKIVVDLDAETVKVDDTVYTLENYLDEGSGE